MAEGPKISLSLGAKKQDHRQHNHHSHHRHSNGTKRPHSALADTDDEDDEGRHQEITHFDISAGGGLHTDKKAQEKKPLVIPVGENSRKKQKSGLPSQNAEAAEAAAAEARAKAKPTTYGLNVNSKDDKSDTVVAPKGAIAAVEFKKKSVDDEALEALLGKKTSSSNAVIPTLTDEATFERQYNDAPNAPTEQDYDAVPIEEFGAAMLRGMGWKDGEAIGRNKGQAPLKPRTLERRAELLGVGAKPAKALGIELGEWGKHANKHERKINQAYAPIMLKNKKTGEMITEEEMQKRLKEQEMGFVEDEKIEEKPRRDKDKKREKERDRGRDDDDRKHKSSRRDRSTSYDSHKHKSSRRNERESHDSPRRRKDDIDSEDERRKRRREKERMQRDRSDGEDRHRSRKDDKHRDKDRERRHRDNDEDHSSRREKSYKDRSDRDRR